MAGSVLLVRHGRTAWNDAGRLQGWLDPELTAAGRRDAERAAAAIQRSHAVTAVGSSPLRRARRTAEILAERIGTAPVRSDPRWRERRFGHLAGADSDAVFSILPEIHPRSAAFEPGAAPPGGESVAGVKERVDAAWAAVADRARAGETVAVVTHTTPIRLALGSVRSNGLRRAVRRERRSPGSVVAVRVDESGATAVADAVGCRCSGD